MATVSDPGGPENGAQSDVVVFPAISALISLICAGLIARDALARPRPDKIAWVIAFAVFTVAAGAEVVGSLTDWTPTLARVYYLTGAVLVVGYLALGELYLLAGNRIHRYAPGAALLITAISASVVINAGIDEAMLASDGWEAIERGPALKALAIGINSVGTVIIVGGLIYSAWRFRKLGIHRNRMVGCLLIAVGTITVGLGGTLTRFGHREYLYIPMAIGVAIIFAGYLQTRKPHATSREPQAPSFKPQAEGDELRAVGYQPSSTVAVHENSSDGQKGTGLGPTNGYHPTPGETPAVDPAVAFIEARLRELDENALSELCRQWSVARPDADAFTRDQARLAWVLRQRLSAEGQTRFDALPVSIRLQVSELYHEVMQPQASSFEPQAHGL
jgi:hypothetical protein